MTRSKHIRLLLFSLALGALLALTIAAGVIHQDDPGSSALCPICHLAHSPLVQSHAPTGMEGLMLANHALPASALDPYREPVFQQHSSRAPPLA